MEHPFIVDGGTRDEVGEEECGRMKGSTLREGSGSIRRSIFHLPPTSRLFTSRLSTSRLSTSRLSISRKRTVYLIGHKNTE